MRHPERHKGAPARRGRRGQSVLLGEQNYTNTEKKFVDFIFDCFISLTDIDFKSKTVLTAESLNDLVNFNLAINSQFRHFSKVIYNAILQAKLHAGDNLRPYIDKSYQNKHEMEERLKLSAEYDYFFDEKAILRCDLETNKNIFVKNILNTIISELSDIAVKIMLLVKLQNKFPFLIRDKVFNEFC